MKNKVLYNKKGDVIMWWAGENEIDLSGNLYIEVEIPDGKNIDYIDVSGDEPTPVFKDVPKTQSEDIAEIKSQIEWIALMADIELPEEE